MQFKNFMTISLSFLTIVSINLLVSDSSKAMHDQENEMEERKTTHVAPKGQKKPDEIELKKENEVISSIPMHQDNSPFGILPDSIMIDIFGFLAIEDLGRASQVSQRWYGVYSKPLLWEKIGLVNYGDYFTRADLKEKPKEKVIHHYLSVRLNVLDTEEEASVSKNFKEKYGLASFIPYFKAYLPSAVKSGHESFGAKVYGKFEIMQDIETKKEIEKLRRTRDNFIHLAKETAEEKEVQNQPYGGNIWNSSYQVLVDLGHPIPKTIVSIPNRASLKDAREINEKLIVLGDEDAAKRKREELKLGGSEYMRLSFLYLGGEREWDIFVESSVDKFCHKGYSFAFGWKIEWLIEKNENGIEFIESMLQNKNPVIRNMGHYLRVFGLKQGKLGYKQNQKKAAQYIKRYNIPY